MRVATSAVCVAILVGGCGGTDLERSRESTALRDLPVASVDIPGTAPRSLEVAEDGSVTRLLDVTGEWNQVSADLAAVVRGQGWTIESIRCVGTGNDVIARRQVGDRWILLESGAGTRAAGIILRVAPDQRPPRTDVAVDGPCPEVLRAAVR